MNNYSKQKRKVTYQTEPNTSVKILETIRGDAKNKSCDLKSIFFLWCFSI